MIQWLIFNLKLVLLGETTWVGDITDAGFFISELCVGTPASARDWEEAVKLEILNFEFKVHSSRRRRAMTLGGVYQTDRFPKWQVSRALECSLRLTSNHHRRFVLVLQTPPRSAFHYPTQLFARLQYISSISPSWRTLRCLSTTTTSPPGFCRVLTAHLVEDVRHGILLYL